MADSPLGLVLTRLGFHKLLHVGSILSSVSGVLWERRVSVHVVLRDVLVQWMLH